MVTLRKKERTFRPVTWLHVCLTRADFLAYSNSIIWIHRCYDATERTRTCKRLWLRSDTLVHGFSLPSLAALQKPTKPCAADSHFGLRGQYRDKAKGWVADESEFDLQQRQTSGSLSSIALRPLVRSAQFYPGRTTDPLVWKQRYASLYDGHTFWKMRR